MDGIFSEHERSIRSESSPRRLRAALALMKLAIVGKVTTSGIENLDHVPGQRKLVVATTHFTDIDVALAAYVLDEHMDIAIADMLPNHNFWKRPAAVIAARMIGAARLIPIDYTVRKHKNEIPGIFNPANYEPMLGAMNDGKVVIMAAHEPSPDRKFARAGVGVPYLASMAGATILPAAVKLDTDRNLGMMETALQTVLIRPPAHVTFGKPIDLSTGPDVGHLGKLIDQSHLGMRLDEDSRAEVHAITTYLRAQGAMILGTLKQLT